MPDALTVRPTERLKGQCSNLLALALTVVHELHVARPRSPYFEFLKATPLPSLPLLWEEADLRWLACSSLLPPGLTVSTASVAAAAAATRAFEDDVLPLMNLAGEDYLPMVHQLESNWMGASSGRVWVNQCDTPSLTGSPTPSSRDRLGWPHVDRKCGRSAPLRKHSRGSSAAPYRAG